MQNPTLPAKTQISQLEGKLCDLSNELLDNVKATQVIRSQLGYAQHVLHGGFKSLSLEFTGRLEALKVQFAEESQAQHDFVAATKKEICDLKAEKRTIAKSSMVLESRIRQSEPDVSGAFSRDEGDI